MKSKKRIIEYSVLLGIILIVVALPFVAGTKSYPLTVIDGNSMYPFLQNGDLVYFSKIDVANIPNGTLIVFIQGDTGSSMLDGLIRPVVIHRVIGELIQADGMVCYTTKGDNNEMSDPGLVRQDHVLGQLSVQIPKVGLLLLFVKSPQGLIATVGIIVIAYLSLNEGKRKEDKQKEALVGALAQKTLKGVIPTETFSRLELAVKHFEEIDTKNIDDAETVALVNWLRRGNLYGKWKVKATNCSTCLKLGLKFDGERSKVVICPHCNAVEEFGKVKASTQLLIGNSSYESVVLEAIDDALHTIGAKSQKRIYAHLEKEFSIKKKEIPYKLDEFSAAMAKLIGIGGKQMELLIKRFLKSRLPSQASCVSENLDLLNYVHEIKLKLNSPEVCDEVKDSNIEFLPAPPEDAEMNEELTADNNDCLTVKAISPTKSSSVRRRKTR